MSLITRCPACETLFKVVPDQLRISEGWVRCGQCAEIFDASLHLLLTPPVAEIPVVEHEGLTENFEATDPTDGASQSVDSDLNSGHLARPDEWPVEPEQVLPDPVADAVSDDPEPDHGSELSDVSFLRDKRSKSFWYKPLMRATLGFLSLVLLSGLAGQLVFHERDRIVASEPGLKPWLLAMCVPLNCILSPLRRIESIVIDSSSFSKIRGDAYSLNFTVKNTAVTALAVPAIELTLTDSLDQPVVRRVFFPAELGGNSNTLATGAEWSASLAMVVNGAGTADRVVGYRLLAFYP